MQTDIYRTPQGYVRTANSVSRFVCASTKALNTPVRLRSYKTADSVDTLSGSGCTIWQAARATSAAVTFFDPIQIGRQQYVDGATGYNNPVRVTLDEAKSIWPDALSRIQCLVSIGTGIPDLKDFGNNIGQVVHTLKRIATETEATEQAFFRDHVLLGVGGRYFRLNVDRGLGGVRLDEHKKKDRIEAASENYLNDHRVREQVVEFLAARAPITAQPRTEYARPRPHQLEYTGHARTRCRTPSYVTYEEKTSVRTPIIGTLTYTRYNKDIYI